MCTIKKCVKSLAAGKGKREMQKLKPKQHEHKKKSILSNLVWQVGKWHKQGALQTNEVSLTYGILNFQGITPCIGYLYLVSVRQNGRKFINMIPMKLYSIML
jgi:hypothetical protein